MTIDSSVVTRNALRWNLAWRTGLIGGAGFLLTVVISRAIVYGAGIFDFMLPGSPFTAYLALLARSFILPALVIGAVAAAVALYWRRYDLGVQTLLFGVLLGVVPAVLIVTFRLVVQLASDASLHFYWPGFFSAIGREVTWGIGLPLFIGAVLGWYFASVSIRRNGKTA